MKITNHNNESILYKTYERLSHGESVRLLSSDWQSFKIPKSLFSFLSRYFEEDNDLVVTPVDSNNLGIIVNIIRAEYSSVSFGSLNNQTLEDAEVLGIERTTIESIIAAKYRSDLARSTQKQNDRIKLEPEVIDTRDTDYDENETKTENPRIISEFIDVNIDDDDDETTVENVLEETDIEGDADKELSECEDGETKTSEVFDKKGNRILEWRLKAERGRRGPRGREILSIECRHCRQVFPGDQIKAFRNHLYRHDIRLKDCGCNLEFSTFNEKERHIKLEHWNHLACNLCPLTSRSQASLQNHMNTVHGSSYSCTICEYFTDRGFKLKRHLEQNHVPNILKPASESTSELSCDECGKVFLTNRSKKDHHKKVHNPRTCSICGKTVKNVRSHIAIMHQEDSEKRFLCPQCGKGFIDSSSLGHHQMNLHIRSRPYKCRYPGCSRGESGYNDRGNRNSHERRVHGAPFKVQ